VIRELKPVFLATFPEIPEVATDSESRQDAPDTDTDMIRDNVQEANRDTAPWFNSTAAKCSQFQGRPDARASQWVRKQPQPQPVEHNFRSAVNPPRLARAGQFNDRLAHRASSGYAYTYTCEPEQYLIITLPDYPLHRCRHQPHHRLINIDCDPAR
jgi:hypothetical protein